MSELDALAELAGRRTASRSGGDLQALAELYGLPMKDRFGRFQVGGPLGGHAGALDALFDVLPGIGDYRGFQRLGEAAKPEIRPNLMGGVTASPTSPGAVAGEAAGLLPVVGDIATGAKAAAAALGPLGLMMARRVDPMAGIMRGQAGAVGSPDLLTGPQTEAVANAITREENWQALERSARRAGIHRSKSTGQYTGAPRGIDSPQKVSGIATRYANRILRGLDAGIDPDYFYAEGRRAVSEVADDPTRTAKLYGPTSTQVGPFENTNYVARVHDQQAMGVPPTATLYPNAMRPEIENIQRGTDPWQGYKKERYTNLLDPNKSQTNDLADMPPNDQWEGRAMGFMTPDGKGRPPTGPAQVAFTDFVRQQALDRVNTRLVAQGKKPLTREQAQAVHWAVIRAETEGRPLEITAKDTLQGALPEHIMQHSWEAQPGGSSGIDIGSMSKEDYAEAFAGTLLDPQGKDRLARSMGARMQYPVVRGTGVYNDEINPGFQTRTIVSQTQGKGLDPASARRVDATEAVRQYALGQEARAYHSLLPAKSATQVDTVDVKTGRPPTEQQTIALQKVLDRHMGKFQGEGFEMSMEYPPVGIVFTDQGYRILNTGQPTLTNKRFSQLIDEIKPELDEIVGGEMTKHRREGDYAEYDWKGGTATKGLLGALDDPLHPGAAQLADSPETRQIMGELAQVYRDLEGRGAVPNEKLVTVLEAWKAGGLPSVRRLVERGLAPAGVLAVLAGHRLSQDEGAM